MQHLTAQAIKTLALTKNDNVFNKSDMSVKYKYSVFFYIILITHQNYIICPIFGEEFLQKLSLEKNIKKYTIY